MSPFRWKILTVGMPVYVAILLIPGILSIILLALENDVGLIMGYVWFGWMIVVNIAVFILLALATKVDVKIEMERYKHLFEPPKTLSDEPITVLDEELTYTLDERGAKLEIPVLEGEQVFDEAQENVFHLDWTRAELALATQVEYRHVYIALAVLPTEFDEGSMPFFIPMTEDVFAFIKKMGFEDRVGSDWDYLFYNPEDAFKQLVKYGRIVKLRNKKTGKVFVDSQGNFIGDE